MKHFQVQEKTIGCSAFLVFCTPVANKRFVNVFTVTYIYLQAMKNLIILANKDSGADIICNAGKSYILLSAFKILYTNFSPYKQVSILIIA